MTLLEVIKLPDNQKELALNQGLCTFAQICASVAEPELQYSYLFRNYTFDDALDQCIEIAKYYAKQPEFDYSEMKRMLAEPIWTVEPKTGIIWLACDGKEFTSALECDLYDKPRRRQMYYDYLLSRRNWFERLFNIKPSMKFYDIQVFKTK